MQPLLALGLGSGVLGCKTPLRQGGPKRAAASDNAGPDSSTSSLQRPQPSTSFSPEEALGLPENGPRPETFPSCSNG